MTTRRPDGTSRLALPPLDAVVRGAYQNHNLVHHYARAVSEMGLLHFERDVCRRFLQFRDVILDIGCGAGRAAIGLRRQGYRGVVGIDFSTQMLQAAAQLSDRGEGAPAFVAGDARHLPFRTAAFDAAIFFFNGLMTIPGNEARLLALQEVRRVLKPLGTLVFTTPQRERTSARSREFWTRQQVAWTQGLQHPLLSEFGDVMLTEADGSPSFVHFPTAAEVTALLRRARFRVLECRNRRNIVAESPEIERRIGGFSTLVWTVTKQRTD